MSTIVERLLNEVSETTFKQQTFSFVLIYFLHGKIQVSSTNFNEVFLQHVFFSLSCSDYMLPVISFVSKSVCTGRYKIGGTMFSYKTQYKNQRIPSFHHYFLH